MCKWLDLAEELELCSSEKRNSNIVRVLRSMLIRARIKYLFESDVRFISKDYSDIIAKLEDKEIITLVKSCGEEMYVLNKFKILFNLKKLSKFSLFFSLLLKPLIHRIFHQKKI